MSVVLSKFLCMSLQDEESCKLDVIHGRSERFLKNECTGTSEC